MRRFALVAIRPEHLENILVGKKVFEYRKVIPNKDLSHLVFYCTTPVKKIIAIAEVLGCVSGTPNHVWTLTEYGSGISKEYFRDYFSGQKHANAFILGNVHKMTIPIELTELSNPKTPPQSFYYLNDVSMDLVSRRQSATSEVPSSMVFVGGIHGVGKSTLCQKAFGPAGYQCVTASTLIDKHGQRIIGKKLVDDVSYNQAALLDQLSSAKEQYCRLILDGHFTLINRREQIEPIEPKVFEEMKPNQLILIKGNTAEIANRLKTRDGKRWSSSFLKKFQSVEESHARYVSAKIGVPLYVFENTASPGRIAKSIQRI